MSGMPNKGGHEERQVENYKNLLSPRAEAHDNTEARQETCWLKGPFAKFAVIGLAAIGLLEMGTSFSLTCRLSRGNSRAVSKYVGSFQSAASEF